MELVQDMVHYLKNVQSNVRNIKKHLLSRNNNKIPNNNGTNGTNETNGTNSYYTYIRDIAKHCFPNENINTSIHIVDYTIKSLAEGQNHKAGSLKNINPLLYAQKVHEKITTSKNKNDCAMLKALSHVIISQMNAMKKKTKGETEIEQLLNSGNIKNNTNIYIKNKNVKLKIRQNGNKLLFVVDDNTMDLKNFRKKYIPRKQLLTQLYVVKNSKDIYLKDL